MHDSDPCPTCGRPEGPRPPTLPMPLGPLVVPDADDAQIEVLPLRWRRVQVQIVDAKGHRVAASIHWQDAIEFGERMIEIARIAGGQEPRPGERATEGIAMRQLLQSLATELERPEPEVEPDPEPEEVEPFAARTGRAPLLDTGRFATMTDADLLAVNSRALGPLEKEQRRAEMTRRNSRRRYDKVRKRPREVAT